MVDKREIQRLLNEYFEITGEITILDSGVVDVSGEVKLIKLTENLPVQFGRVGGSFYCYDNKLTSLEGAPSSVGSGFYCSNNKLTSLEGAPSSVGLSFVCRDNQLTSLEGAPSSVGGGFYCQGNQLTSSLKGAPSSVDGKFILDYSPNLPLLRTIVANGGVSLRNKSEFSFAQEIEDVLNQFKGQGKRGFLAATSALLKLEKELQKEDPSTNIRENIKW
jgi:hypothetical protein